METNTARQYEHALVAGFDVSGWTYRMMSDLAEGLRAIGYNTLMIMNKPGEPDCRERILQAILEFMQNYPHSFVLIDMNHRLILDPWQGELPRRFSFIVDNPLTHYEGLNQSKAKTTLGLLDHYHLNIVHKMELNYDVVFFPHAGPVRNKCSLAGDERDIDVLFVGNIVYPLEPTRWRAMLSGNTDAVQNIVLNTIDEIIAGSADPFAAFGSHCTKHGLDPVGAFSQESLAELFKFAENCAESYLRHKYLQQLTDLNVHIAGEIPADVRTQIKNNVVYYEYLDFDQCVDLMQRSKFVLNVCPKHLGGAHERIWYGMAHGCGIATTPSTYLEQWYQSNQNIIYTNADDWVGRVKSLLGDDRKLDELVAQAGSIYDECHTWNKRVEIIDKALNT